MNDNELQTLIESPFAPAVTPLKAWIKKCQALDLINVESSRIGWTGVQAPANDPFVKFEFNHGKYSWGGQTVQIDNAGSNAEWQSISDLSFKCDESVLRPIEADSAPLLRCSVFDYNVITSHVLIGAGEVDVSPALDCMNSLCEIKVDLVTKKKEPAGKLLIWLEINIDKEELKRKVKDAEEEARKAAALAKVQEEAEARRLREEEEAAAVIAEAVRLDREAAEMEGREASVLVTATQTLVNHSIEMKKRHKKSLNIMDRFADCELGGQKALDISLLSLLEYPEDAVIFPNIRQLLCYSNKLTCLPDLGAMYRFLEVLDISRNNLSRLDEVDFGLLRALRSLDVSRNLLVTLTPNITKLIRLENLQLHRNQLETLPEGMSALKSLQVLNLECNNLSSLCEEIGDMASLRDINLNDNPNLDPSTLPETTRELHDKRILLLSKQGRKALIHRSLGFKASAASKKSLML